MRILLYGLDAPLLLPNLDILAFDEWNSAQQALEVMQPDLIVMHETDSPIPLEWLSIHLPELPVAIIARDSGARAVRYWTAAGATHVWAETNWAQCLSQTFGEASVGLQEATEAFSRANVMDDRETLTIAVAGVYSGAGSTHTALSIAHYLARQGEKVAIWEASPTPCFDFLEYNLGGTMNKRPKFELGPHITAFKESANPEWVEAVLGDYRYIVYDLGDMSHRAKGMDPVFARADIPVLVASASLWRQQEVVQFCRKHANSRQARWRIVFPLAEQSVVYDMQAALAGRASFRLPRNSDPMRASEEMDDALRATLGIMKPVRSNRWSLFGGKRGSEQHRL